MSNYDQNDVGVHHVAHAVSNTATAVAQYESMGYSLFKSFTSHSTPAKVAMMTHPRRVGIELFEFEDISSEGAQMLRHHVAFEVPALESELERYVGAGYRLVRDISNAIPVQRLCFIEDGVGNLFELVEPWPEELLARATP